jgi:hypothetical protein
MRKMQPYNRCGFEPAMTFRDIADSLGVTERYVMAVYKSALYKLRKRYPEELRQLIQLSFERQRIRNGQSSV